MWKNINIAMTVMWLEESMGRLNVRIKESIDHRFRREVFRRKGMKKGNLTNAIEEAMIMWISTTPSDVDASKLNKEDAEN